VQATCCGRAVRRGQLRTRLGQATWPRLCHKCHAGVFTIIRLWYCVGVPQGGQVVIGEETLLAQIAAERNELSRLVSLRGLCDPGVMAKSREIDYLVVRYYRIVLRRRDEEKLRAAITS